MKAFRKALALLLILAMVSAVSVTASAASALPSDYYKGVFYYRPSVSELTGEADSFDVYAYSDEVFLLSGREFHETLATTSMSLAVASVSSTRVPSTAEGYAGKSRNAVAFLEDCGFSDIAVNADYQLRPTMDSLGVACAHKTISDGSVTYPLVVMIPRSAGYESEWGNNFVIGSSGDAKGFDDGAEKLLAFAGEYIAEHQISGNIKVWCVGYSRGAAVANLVGKKLIDAPKDYLGDAIELSSDNLYVYTFGTPSAAAQENNPRDPKYAGIFNSFSVTEAATALAPADMGFERYGTDRILEDDANYKKMLQYLSLSNPSIYRDYITTVGPNLFHAKKISLLGETTGIVDDEDSYIPNDVTTYLRGLSAYLTRISGGREMYAERYEKGFSSLIGYYMSLMGEDIDAFTSALTDNDDTLYLVTALYAYFMRSKQAEIDARDRVLAVGVAKELAAAAAPQDAAGTGVGVAEITKIALKLLEYLNMTPDELREIAAEYLADILPAALAASGASDEQIAFFGDKDEMEPLAHVIAHLLLGNIWQDDSVEPLSINNQQIKNAATLIGNFNNCIYDHYNEVILSRLKAEDGRYAAAPITDAQIKGYRRVTIGTDAKVSGTVTDGSGKTVGVIRDGVLTSAADKWVGFTRCDDGDFFRIPIGKDYRISLTVSEGADLKATVKEYDPYEAVAHPVYESVIHAEPGDEIVIDLPAVDAHQQIPSRTAYRLGLHRAILGDADCDNGVTVLDATAIQRFLAGLDNAAFDPTAADADEDDGVTVLDATAIQRFLAGLPANEHIGRPIGA